MGCKQELSSDSSSDVPVSGNVTIEAVTLSSPKSLFVASETEVASSQGYSQLSTSKKKKLMQKNQYDEVTNVIFKDFNGGDLEVEIERLIPLSSDYVGVELSIISNDGSKIRKNVLIRIADGKIYDLSNYSLLYAQLKENYLYTYDSLNLMVWRIDLNTMLASAVNNPAYNKIYDGPGYNAGGYGGAYKIQYAFLLSGDNLVGADHSSGPGYGMTLYFGDNSAPNATHQYWIADLGGGGSGGFVYGEDGYVYAIRLIYGGLGEGVHSTKLEFTPSGIVSTNTRFGSYPGTTFTDYIGTENNYTLVDRSRYLLFKTGFYKMSPVPGAGISLTWNARVLSALPDGTTLNFAVISGDYVYWRSGNSIYRLDLSDNSSSQELVVTSSNIINFKVVSGSVIFTKYVTGTNVGTYQVDEPGDIPQLLNEDDMEVQQIIEL